MESQSLTYSTLPPGRNLRLLKIHPGSPNDALVCELFTTALDDSPAYTALSYVWGDPTKNAHLTCSGHACKITQSLLDGLCRIRRPDEVQLAWADAICINQKDNVEKGSQVDLMGAIYDTARDVLVWLGPDDTASAEEAFRCLTTINQKIETRTDRESFNPTLEENSLGLELLQGPKIYSSGATRSVIGMILGERGTDCLERLFKLPWFSRVWVLQEVGLATAATAFWGGRSIEFSEIAAFIYNAYSDVDLKHFLGPELSGILSGAPLYAFWNVWCTYDKENSWLSRRPVLRKFAESLAQLCDIDFILVLEASRYFQATNKLDHIYAFLGHPRAKKTGSHQTWLQANYSLNLEDQHQLLATSLAQESLNFLVQAHQTEESLNSSSGYPSWVPRWNEKTGNHADAFWEAWDASLRKTGGPFKAQVDEGKLSVSGYLFDFVDQFTETMVDSDFEELELGAGRLIEKCWELAVQKPCPFEPEEAVEAFASTLACQYKPQGQQPEETESILEQFIGFCMRANSTWLYKNIKSEVGRWTMHTVLTAAPMFGPAFKSYATNRRFFNTREGGFWGLGPAAMQRGDVCAVLLGADVPFVLRPTRTKGEYKVVGQCYMYKFMDGDAVLAWRDGQDGYAKEGIVLV